MRNLLSKTTAILLGAVFLLGGFASTASAQTTNIVYFYQGRINSAENTNWQTLTFSTKEACQASLSSSQLPFKRQNSCVATTQKAVDQIAQSEAKRLADIAEAEAARADSMLLNRLHCGIPVMNFTENKVQDCIPVVTYYLVYKPISVLLAGSGYLFDIMLTLSIDSNFVNQDFINDTWTIVRDFSNMLFIFILLYTGVQTVLGIGDWRKTVLFVVVMALLINFSLFFTKVVIDAGNVLALGVYSSMGTPKSVDDQSFQVSGVVPERDISGSLAGAFAPQKFLKVSGEVMALDATIVFVIATIVSGFAAYVFFKVALIFVGRLIAFWFLMIVSPFAFISLALPGKANKFHSWLDLLLAQSFIAPVFLFMIYLIMKVVSSGNGILEGLIKDPSPSASFTFDKVLAPVIVATLIIIALKQALEYAESMAGDFGKLGAGLVGGITGIAAGVATGGAALAGRAVGGRLAQSLYERGTFQKMATGESAAGRMVGRQLIGLNEKARTGTWDARGIGAVQQAAKMGGISQLGKPSEGAKGGFEGAMKRQAQADEAFAKKLKMTDQEKEAVKTEVTEKTKEVERVITEKKTIVAAAAEKVASAQGSVDTARNAGRLDPGLSKVLEAAKKEKEEADKALAEAEKAQAGIKKADDIIKSTEQNRRDVYAEHVESKIRTAISMVTKGGAYSHAQAERTASKLRKEEEKEKKLEDLIKEGVEKRVKEELDKKEKAA